ncbi:hypothetical protein ACWGB8_10765 [Kitasatospora sp. NPDC054939]
MSDGVALIAAVGDRLGDQGLTVHPTRKPANDRAQGRLRLTLALIVPGRGALLTGRHRARGIPRS